MSSNEEKLPREFGKYYLIERIAVGGMAELYRAKLYGASGFEKDLAIKKVLPALARDDAFTQMFLDEAMITVTLNHGNIVSIIDFGEIDGEYFLVMEYIDGVDLQSLVKRSAEIDDPIPPPVAAFITMQICRGLDYAHRKVGSDGTPLEIVHRDVSPHNVLISFEGEVKILDFGIARAASRITSTQAGVVKGKMAYMSPEQLSGINVDRRCDIFSAGIILYEMLTNQRPFQGTTPQETMAAINRGTYEKPQKLNRKVDKRLTGVIRRSLEKNLRKRYPTAGEMANDLSEYLHGTGLFPDDTTLAAFIPKRLPDARPRTVPPTPIRAIHRGNESNTPPRPQAAPAAAGTPKPAPVFQPPAPQPQAPIATPSQGSLAAGGEVVSFDLLGLPQYPEESSAPPPPADAVSGNMVESYLDADLSAQGYLGVAAAKPDAEPVCAPPPPAPVAAEPLLSTDKMRAAAFPQRRSSTKWIVIFGILFLALAAVAVLVMSPWAGQPAPVQPDEPVAVPAPQEKPAEAQPPPTPVDPPKDTPAAAPVAAHADPEPKVVKPKKPRNSKTPKPKKVAQTTPAQSDKTGTLRINSEPFAVVFLGEEKLGPTPQMNIKLPAGSHTLTLKNDALGLTKRVRVRIEPDKVQTVFVDLNE